MKLFLLLLLGLAFYGCSTSTIETSSNDSVYNDLAYIDESLIERSVASDSVCTFNEYNYNDSLLSSEQIMSANLANLEKLSKTPGDNSIRERAAYISKDSALEIYNAVSRHPVADQCMIPKYDPQNRGIGYCFGRAMTVHLESLYRGIAKDSIKKMFAQGALQTGSNKWRYHVTTIVKGPTNIWWAIDPIIGGVITADEWYRYMKKFDSNGKMKIYFTNANQLTPACNVKYNKQQLYYDQDIKRYFGDLLKWYRDNGPVVKSRIRSGN